MNSNNHIIDMAMQLASERNEYHADNCGFFSRHIAALCEIQRLHEKDYSG